MQAIEFEAVPQHHSILIPENIQVSDGLPLRVLLLIDNVEAVNETAPEAAGSEEVFQLLAGLSDDFMADGRQQPAMQVRTNL